MVSPLQRVPSWHSITSSESVDVSQGQESSIKRKNINQWEYILLEFFNLGIMLFLYFNVYLPEEQDSSPHFRRCCPNDPETETTVSVQSAPPWAGAGWSQLRDRI